MQITFALADFADIGGNVAVTLCIGWLIFSLERMLSDIYLNCLKLNEVEQEERKEINTDRMWENGMGGWEGVYKDCVTNEDVEIEIVMIVTIIC